MLTTVILAGVLQASAPVPVAASVLPPSRHAVASGDPVTFFAAMVNQGTGDAVNCRIEIAETGPFTYTYRAFDPATSSFIADPNTPVDIAGGGTQVFVLGFEFSGTMDRTSFEPAYVCDNGEALPVHALTNITLTSSATPQPDILALASTNGGPGHNAAWGNSVFAVAITNLAGQTGIDVPITISADAMDRTMFARFTVCEIDDQAQCITPRSDQLTTTLSGRESRHFAIWIGGTYSFSLPYFDFVRVRTRIVDPDTNLLFGSTSVAHSNGHYGVLCSGALPSVPWSGSIVFQEGDGTTGQIIRSRVENLNFYGDGMGRILAVPIDRQGTRFVGNIGFEGEDNIEGCIPEPSASMLMRPMSPAVGQDPASDEWQGWIRWTILGATGAAQVDDGTTILRNRLRAVYTATHAYTYPIAAGVQFRQTTPPGQIEGEYFGELIRPDGALDRLGSWTVANSTAGGPIIFAFAGEDDATCQMTIGHRSIEVHESIYDEPIAYRNNRLVEAVVSDCSRRGEDIEGQYHGVMVYQPMTVAGAPDENGLEVILTPSDPEQEQHILWFLLRQ